MDNSLIYRLPERREQVSEIVGAIPPDWAYINGDLIHPEELKTQNRIAENTRLSFSRYRMIHPIVTGRLEPTRSMEDRPRYHAPDFVGIFTEQKLPFGVNFEQAGFGHGDLTFEIARELARRFILKGYTGYLAFHGCNEREVDFGKITIWQEGHRIPVPGSHYSEMVSLPPNVEVEWNDVNERDKKGLDGFLDILDGQGLEKVGLETA